jgi:ABC-type branched-subunit amino acid transport system ATPase component
MGDYLLPKAESGDRIDHVLQTFPSLRPLLKRRGKLLSGGERNLLGIGRCLISSPKLLILDEPTAGLSPILARLRRTVPRPVRPHTAASRARPAPAPGHYRPGSHRRRRAPGRSR